MKIEKKLIKESLGYNTKGKQTFADKKQNSLNKASLDAIGKINDQVKKVVKDISEEKQIDVVIGSSQIVFSNKNAKKKGTFKKRRRNHVQTPLVTRDQSMRGSGGCTSKWYRPRWEQLSSLLIKK